MMRLNKLFIIGMLASTFIISCKKDDKNDIETVPPRDRGEQAIDDDEAIIAYLQTHFYNAEDFQNPAANFNYVVNFDTIAGENANKTPIIDSDLLTTKTVRKDSVDYTIYILKIREGEGKQPKFSDSIFTTRKIELLNRTVSENNVIPNWDDLLGLIYRNQNNQLTMQGGNLERGFKEAITDFKTGKEFEVMSDGSIQWSNDYGIGAVFIPSGLGYFSGSQPRIPAYSPLIISFKLYVMAEADHDNDGIPSFMEVDGEGYDSAYGYDTDQDGLPNYSDLDDDGDGTLTKEEITINEDGSIEFPDRNGNGIPNYLDPEEFENVNEV